MILARTTPVTTAAGMTEIVTETASTGRDTTTTGMMTGPVMTEKGGPGTMKGGINVFLNRPPPWRYHILCCLLSIKYAQVALLSEHRADCNFGGPVHSLYSTIVPEHCVDHDQKALHLQLCCYIWFPIHPSETHRDPGGAGRQRYDPTDCIAVSRPKAAVQNPVSSLGRPRVTARTLVDD